MQQIMELLASIGLFLFAMHFLETSLKELSGRKFKIFLQKMAARPITAIAGSALITAILQSSSLVGLLVLAFLGAGVFSLRQSLALILGANLGTTLGSWLIALLGFDLNIDRAAFPAIFVGAILLLANGRQKQKNHIAYFLLGFGLIFLSLFIMRTSMGQVVQQFNIQQYLKAGPYVFLLIGFTITLLLQSSSVTMAIALTAIHGNLLPLQSAAFLVLGGETATTIKIWLAALGGSAGKKQVAAGNFFFNLILTVFAVVYMTHLLRFITVSAGITEPLYALVSFSTLINLLGIIVFTPFLNLYAKLLIRLFPTGNHQKVAYLTSKDNTDADSAVLLLQKETGYFIYNTMLLNKKLLSIPTGSYEKIEVYELKNNRFRFDKMSPEEHYRFIKELHGEIQAAYFRYAQLQLPAENNRLSLFISSIRNAMHAAKSIKDIADNINNLSRSSKSLKFDFFTSFQQQTANLHQKLLTWLQNNPRPGYQDILQSSKEIESNYTNNLNRFYREAADTKLSELEITTLINFSRECFSANRSMLMAVKDLMLDEKEAALFNEEPVFIS